MSMVRASWSRILTGGEWNCPCGNPSSGFLRGSELIGSLITTGRSDGGCERGGGVVQETHRVMEWLRQIDGGTGNRRARCNRAAVHVPEARILT